MQMVSHVRWATTCFSLASYLPLISLANRELLSMTNSHVWSFNASLFLWSPLCMWLDYWRFWSQNREHVSTLHHGVLIELLQQCSKRHDWWASLEKCRSSKFQRKDNEKLDTLSKLAFICKPGACVKSLHWLFSNSKYQAWQSNGS